MKSIIIWGAAGGKGQALLERFSADGWKTYTVARDTSVISSLADHVFEANFDDPGRIEQIVSCGPGLSPRPYGIKFLCECRRMLLRLKKWPIRYWRPITRGIRDTLTWCEPLSTCATGAIN